MIRDCLTDRATLRRIRHRFYTRTEDWESNIPGHPTADQLEHFNDRSITTLLQEAYHSRVGTLSWSEAEYFGTIGRYGKEDTLRRRAPTRFQHYVTSEKEETTRMVQIGDMIPTEIVQRSQCWRKERHESREAAEVHLKRLKESGNSSDEAALGTYLCRHCDHWHVGHDRLKKDRPMTDLAATLTNGGTVTVFLGTGYDLPREYASHPQIDGIAANTLVPSKAGSILKANTRAVILTDRINYQIHTVLTQELQRRRMTTFIRRSNSDLKQALDQIFHREQQEERMPEPERAPEPVAQIVEQPQPVETRTETEVEPARRIAPRGAIPSLVEECWPKIEAMNTTEGGKYVYAIAIQRQIPTTPLSVEQAVRTRRAGGPTKWATGRFTPEQPTPAPQPTNPEPPTAPPLQPPVAVTETEQMKAVRLLDNMIGGLQSVRAFVSTIDTNHGEIEAVRARNRELEEKMRAIKSAFGL